MSPGVQALLPRLAHLPGELRQDERIDREEAERHERQLPVRVDDGDHRPADHEGMDDAVVKQEIRRELRTGHVVRHPRHQVSRLPVVVVAERQVGQVVRNVVSEIGDHPVRQPVGHEVAERAEHEHDDREHDGQRDDGRDAPSSGRKICRARSRHEDSGPPSASRPSGSCPISPPSGRIDDRLDRKPWTVLAPVAIRTTKIVRGSATCTAFPLEEAEGDAGSPTSGGRPACPRSARRPDGIHLPYCSNCFR
jgi:hypothetical protein